MRLTKALSFGWREWLALAGSLVCLVLLFSGGPGYPGMRSLSYLWNQGHVLCFFLWCYLLLRTWGLPQAGRFFRQTLLVVGFSLIFGGVVEVLQGLVGRAQELADVLRDLLGGLLALAFAAPGSRLWPKILRRGVQVAVLVLLLASSWPLARSAVDDALARVQFPLLAGFETPFEERRWGGNARFGRVVEPAFTGNGALRIALTTGRYSGISLRYFPRDWRGYRFLQLALYNPDDEPLEVHLRVHDQHHRHHGNRYRDRYNRTFSLQAGWNALSLPLEEMARAPQTRVMDLARIEGLGIFVAKLAMPRILFLDEVRLSR